MDQQLYMVVFGESILNDAVALILFRFVILLNLPITTLSFSLRFLFLSICLLHCNPLFFFLFVLIRYARASVNYVSGQIWSSISIFFVIAFGSLLLGVGVAVVLSAVSLFLECKAALSTVMLCRYSDLSTFLDFLH